MKRVVFGLMLTGTAMFFGVRAYAHHSFTATYFEDRTVKIEGEMAQFLFRNPHSFVTIEVKEADGKVTRWGVEWGASGQLGRQGITRETLKEGDHVIVVGNPGRTPEDHRMKLVNITRPSDGWKWGGSFD